MYTRHQKNIDIEETKTIWCSLGCEGHSFHPKLMVCPLIDNTYDIDVEKYSPVLCSRHSEGAHGCDCNNERNPMEGTGKGDHVYNLSH